MRREFLLPATVPQQLLDALEDIAEETERIYKINGGRLGGYKLRDALARLDAAREQAKENG